MGIFGSVGKALSSFFGPESRPAPNTRPNGGDGIQAYSGYLATNERNPELVGLRKWTSYANAQNTTIVTTGIRYINDLLAGTKWDATPNPLGGADAERAVDIVKHGLITAQLPKPWASVAAKQGQHIWQGFALHEWTIKRRAADGMVVFADLSHRPQHTVDRWDKPSDREDWSAISQLTAQGNRYVIPRQRLLYTVDDAMTDAPDGVGLLRAIVELIKRLGFFESLEAMAFSTDLRGMPVGTAPLGRLKTEAAQPGLTAAQIDAAVGARLAAMQSVVTNLFRDPEKPPWLILDSAPHTDPDGTISAMKQWSFDLVRGESGSLIPLAAAIGRLQLEIARLIGIESVMMGGTSSGSHAMHADKTTMLMLRIANTVRRIGDAATRDLARPLIALNGLDPDTCTPIIVGEPPDTEAVESVCRALQLLGAAGLAPNDPARNIVRGRAGLPPEPEQDEAAMGAYGRPPDPSAGEVDVPVDDLGPQGGPAVAPGRSGGGR